MDVYTYAPRTQKYVCCISAKYDAHIGRNESISYSMRALQVNSRAWIIKPKDKNIFYNV